MRPPEIARRSSSKPGANAIRRGHAHVGRAPARVAAVRALPRPVDQDDPADEGIARVPPRPPQGPRRARLRRCRRRRWWGPFHPCAACLACYGGPARFRWPNTSRMRLRSSGAPLGRHRPADVGLEGDARRAMQHHDAVADLERLVDRVGDEQRRLAALAHQAQELRAQALGGHLVERRERLVAQDQHRIDGERPGDGDALAHAAGERVRVVVLVAGEAELGEPLRARSPASGLRSAPRMSRPSSTLSMAVRQGISRSPWKTMPILPRSAAKSPNGSMPVDGDAPRGRLGQAGDQVEDGRLAAAGLAEHGDDLAARHLEREPVDGRERAGAVGPLERLGHVLEGDGNGIGRRRHQIARSDFGRQRSAHCSIAVMTPWNTRTKTTSCSVQAMAPAMSNSCCWRSSS